MAGILLIEPDRKLARTYASLFAATGHAVRTAATAQAAICMADDRAPDLVVLELQLVAHSGIEFLYEFRSYVDWRQVPVVVLSGVPPAEFAVSRRLLTEQLGVRAYHYKPQTSLAALRRTVDTLLAKDV